MYMMALTGVAGEEKYRNYRTLHKRERKKTEREDRDGVETAEE